jgi:hypothetical protein
MSVQIHPKRVRNGRKTFQVQVFHDWRREQLAVTCEVFLPRLSNLPKLAEHCGRTLAKTTGKSAHNFQPPSTRSPAHASRCTMFQCHANSGGYTAAASPSVIHLRM